MKTMYYQLITFCMLIFAGPVYPCTTFLIAGKYTSDGKPILFKNRDTETMQNSLVIFSDGKYKYLGLVDGNDEWEKMVWGGFNETGFAIINSAAYNNNIGDTAQFMDQEGVVMKLALQTCKTLADFESLLNSLPRPMGLDANFGVIDAFGGAAFYETGNYDFTKYDANDPDIAPAGMLIRTNHSLRADPEEGFGYCRFNTATAALEDLLTAKSLKPADLFGATSRNLFHSLTKTDLRDNVPLKRDLPEFRFFIDYIPRESTSSAILIIGVKDQSNAKDIMAYTILGFPLTSVAIPAWITGNLYLPEAVAMRSDLTSPICTAALALKDKCFPVKHDRGWNYINLSVVINKENNGYLQLLAPVETQILNETADLITQLELGKKNERDILLLYNRIDNLLEKKYKELFDITLFD